MLVAYAETVASSALVAKSRLSTTVLIDVMAAELTEVLTDTVLILVFKSTPARVAALTIVNSFTVYADTDVEAVGRFVKLEPSP